MTTLPDVSLEDARLVLLVDLGRRLEHARAGCPSCFSFGSSLVRSGPNSLPTPSSLWQATQVATWNICLPLPNERPWFELLDRRGQVLELPLLARPVRTSAARP